MGLCFSCDFGTDVPIRHYTEEYKCPEPVFRRGIKFNLAIPVIDKKGLIKKFNCIEIKAGELNPHSIRFESLAETIEGWKVRIARQEMNDKLITLKLTSPSNAIVGLYTVNVYHGGNVVASQKFNLLFNSWNRFDDVFLPLEEMRKEYIQATTTTLYVGTTNSIEVRPWILGQFEADSIAASMYLLDKIPAELRRSAKAVSRSLSALVNSNDDMGVIAGQWDGNYADGTNPISWVSSVDILRKYVKTRYPVKYGQCWVFSGVLATTCRAVGIPCRCITNFESFHDNDGTHAWELYLDQNMNIIEISSESVWNYHCWNEVWINDTVKEYSGWHVIDATPQERSAGIYRLGPAPKYAIKNGILNVDYDVGFVYAEVSAKKIFHVQQPDGSFRKSMEKEGDIGKLVATKKMGTNEMEDITSEYKIIGGNTDMRAISDARDALINKLAQVKILCDENLNFGSSFNFSVNFDDIKKAVKIRIIVFLVSYRGRVSEKLHDVSKSITENLKYDKTIDGKDIAEKAGTEYNTLKIMAILMDGNSVVSQEEKLVNLVMPQIKIYGVPSIITANVPIRARVEIINPFPYPLTNVKVYLNSDALEKRQKAEISELKPGEKVTEQIEVLFTRIGPATLNASMDANEAGGFINSMEVNIRE